MTEIKFKTLVTVVFLFVTIPAAIGLDSLAEAYLEQGKVVYDRGDLMGAKRLFNQAAVHAVKTYDSPLHKASIFNNAGEVYRRLFELKGRNYQPDEEDRATAPTLKIVCPNDPLDSILPEASAEWMAQRYLKLALEIKENTLGTFSLDVARSMENLASLYLAIERVDEAEALLRKALKIRETKEGLHSSSIAPICFRLGKALKDRSYRHSDDNAKSAALNDAVSNFQRAKRLWLSSNSAPELIAAACQETSFCHYLLFGLLGQPVSLDLAERLYDESEQRYQKNLPRLKKRYDEFKSVLHPVAVEIELFWERKVLEQKTSDGRLPASAGDELVRLMKAKKRLGKTEDYKEAQELYNKYCRTNQ